MFGKLLGAVGVSVGCSVLWVWGLAGNAQTVLAASRVGHQASSGALSNPTLVFVLLLVATLGIGLEVLHPGSVIFGTIGVMAGILALLGLLVLPVDAVGGMVLVLAVMLLVIDTSGHSHGLLTVFGVGLAIVGGMMLFRGTDNVWNPLVVVAPVVWGVIWVGLSRRALRVRRLPFSRSGRELVGRSGVVRSADGETGMAMVGGELWRVASWDREPLRVGQSVEVMVEDKLTLLVTVGAEAAVDAV